MLSLFHRIPERVRRTDGQTDRQTDRIAISISRVSVLTCDKNYDFRPISRYIPHTIQDTTIVIMEGE